MSTAPKRLPACSQATSKLYKTHTVLCELSNRMGSPDRQNLMPCGGESHNKRAAVVEESPRTRQWWLSQTKPIVLFASHCLVYFAFFGQRMFVFFASFYPAAQKLSFWFIRKMNRNDQRKALSSTTCQWVVSPPIEECCPNTQRSTCVRPRCHWFVEPCEQKDQKIGPSYDNVWYVWCHQFCWPLGPPDIGDGLLYNASVWCLCTIWPELKMSKGITKKKELTNKNIPWPSLAVFGTVFVLYMDEQRSCI